MRLTLTSAVLAALVSAEFNYDKFIQNFDKKVEKFGLDEANLKLFRRLAKKYNKSYEDTSARNDAYVRFLGNIKKIENNPNMTLDSPFFDEDEWHFRTSRLMLDRSSEDYHRNHQKAAYYGLDVTNKALQKRMGTNWPIEIPAWLKDCIATMSCGLSGVEFPWECPDAPAADDFPTPSGGYPTNLDWSTTDNPAGVVAVTPVKDQERCGSCYSFAGLGALEGLMLRNHMSWLPGGHDSNNPSIWKGLSEQEIIDCMDDNARWFGPFINHGCNGGWPSNVFLYSTVREAIRNLDQHPYKSGTTKASYPGSCQFLEGKDDPDNGLNGKIPGACYKTKKGDKEQLKRALYHNGPIAIVIDSSSPDLQLYKSGVVRPSGCSDNQLNHAVLLVGYGEENGEKYWKIKNSWGDWWGDNGYFKLARENNLCGVTSVATYVTYEDYNLM